MILRIQEYANNFGIGISKFPNTFYLMTSLSGGSNRINSAEVVSPGRRFYAAPFRESPAFVNKHWNSCENRASDKLSRALFVLQYSTIDDKKKKWTE